MIAVGVDVGKAFLDVAVHGQRGVQRYPNTTGGIGRLVKLLNKRRDVRIVVEATGGYEAATLEACAKAGLWIARVNPRQARDFAKATGQLAKTDALDARVLAEMVSVLLPRLRRHQPSAEWESELKSWLRRRNQVTEQIVTNTQQLAMTAPAVVRLMKKTLEALKQERVQIDAAMKGLLDANATPAQGHGPDIPGLDTRTVAGAGPIEPATNRQAGRRGAIEPRQRTKPGQAKDLRGERAAARGAIYGDPVGGAMGCRPACALPTTACPRKGRQGRAGRVHAQVAVHRQCQAAG